MLAPGVAIPLIVISALGFCVGVWIMVFQCSKMCKNDSSVTSV